MRIVVSAQAVDGMLRVDVIDDGRGLVATGVATAGGGVGLANLRDRLAAIHGAAARLDVVASEPRGVVATIRIPLPA